MARGAAASVLWPGSTPKLLVPGPVKRGRLSRSELTRQLENAARALEQAGQALEELDRKNEALVEALSFKVLCLQRQIGKGDVRSEELNKFQAFAAFKEELLQRKSTSSETLHKELQEAKQQLTIFQQGKEASEMQPCEVTPRSSFASTECPWSPEVVTGIVNSPFCAAWNEDEVQQLKEKFAALQANNHSLEQMIQDSDAELRKVKQEKEELEKKSFPFSKPVAPNVLEARGRRPKRGRTPTVPKARSRSAFFDMRFHHDAESPPATEQDEDPWVKYLKDEIRRRGRIEGMNWREVKEIFEEDLSVAQLGRTLQDLFG